MTAVNVSAPPFNTPIVDSNGILTRAWYVHFLARHEQAGGSMDKIDAAHAAALAAAPAASEVVAVGGLHLGGPIGGNVSLALYRAADLAASLPTTGNLDGDMAYAIDGRSSGEGAAAGTGCQVWWKLGAWYAVWSGLAVTT